MLGPHWIRCTTKGVHTVSQTKATAIYVLSELRFSCPHRKDLRSHREGTYTPSGVYQRKTTTIVMLYVKMAFDTRTLIGPEEFYVICFTFCDLRRTCPHYRLAISKIRQETFQNVARLWLIRFAMPTTPALHRSQDVKCEQISSDLRSGEVWCGQGRA